MVLNKVFNAIKRWRTKLWAVNGHRVKEYQVTIPGTAPLGVSDRVAGRKKTKYQCIDCHQKEDDREEFKEVECYEVV